MKIEHPNDAGLAEALAEYDRQVARQNRERKRYKLARMSDLDFALLLDSAREELKQRNARWASLAGAERAIILCLNEQPVGQRLRNLTAMRVKCKKELDDLENGIVAQRSFVRDLENELSRRTWNRGVSK